MKTLPPLLLLFAIGLASAKKSAEDYFHGAAYKYIAGRHQEAVVEVEEGLRTFPGDAHLQALDGLLKQMKDQQRQDQNQGGGQNDDKKDQKNDKNQHKKNEGQKKDANDQKQNPDKAPQDSSKKDEQNKPEKGSGEKRDSADRDSSEGKNAPRKPGQMSKEEAERLLNSFADEEKKEQRDRQRTGKRAEVEQDW